MDEVEQLQQLLRYQESVDIVCPDCDAHITNDVVLRKRKWESGPSTSRAAEEEGPDEVTIALRDQNTHDLICPVCECLVTRDLILRKRKREFSEEEDDEPGELGSWGYSLGPSSEDSDQDEKLGEVLRAQTTHDLLCPDCEAPVTRDVILHRRRKSDAEARGKEGAKLKEIVIRKDGEEETAESEVLLKGYRAATSAEVRRFQEEKKSHALTCPDCKFPIPYEALLQQSSETASKGSLEEIIAHRDSRKKDNPWKARYERDFEKVLPRMIVEGEEEEAAQTREATYGAVANKSLTEPLLPIEPSSPRRPTTILVQSESLGTIAWDLLYFVFLIILWLIWYFLHLV